MTNSSAVAYEAKPEVNQELPYSISVIRSSEVFKQPIIDRKEIHPTNADSSFVNVNYFTLEELTDQEAFMVVQDAKRIATNVKAHRLSGVKDVSLDVTYLGKDEEGRRKYKVLGLGKGYSIDDLYLAITSQD